MPVEVVENFPIPDTDLSQVVELLQMQNERLEFLIAIMGIVLALMFVQIFVLGWGGHNE